MKKDIEWLKEEVGELPCVDAVFSRGGSSYIDSAVPVMAVYDLLDQLDEPEVLSLEWIETNKKEWTNLQGAKDYIAVDKLQNLLVPKQELPVIPKFVADWIESRKDNYPYDVIGVYLRMNESSANEQTREVLRWVHESELNRGSFARAWTDGFTVEEEQKYRVLDEGNIPFLAISNGEVNREPMHMTIYAKGRDNAQFALTEQEIKDYDPRYMTFAKPVEELEE